MVEVGTMKYYLRKSKQDLYRILPNGHRERWTGDEWFLVTTYTAPIVLEMKYIELSKEEVIKRFLKS